MLGSEMDIIIFIPPLKERGLNCNHLVHPLVRLSVRSHFRNRYLSFYWKKWFYIWYMALAWWLVPCLPFPGLRHIYFLFTVRLWIFHVCRNENFRNSYLSFYWKKWFYIWYMALAWWLVPCLHFPGLPHDIACNILLASTSDQSLIFTYCDFRRLISITELFCATEVSQYVLPLGLALCEDRVSEVRRMAFRLVGIFIECKY